MVKKSATLVIDEWVRKSEKRMVAVLQTSTEELISQANLPVAKGGRMRVDTGFLRSSGRLSRSGMPTGPMRPDRGAQYQKDGVDQATIVMLVQTQLGDRLFYGWTASYASIREYHDGFLQQAVKNWNNIVKAAIRKGKVQIR